MTVTTEAIKVSLESHCQALVNEFPEVDWYEHIQFLHNTGQLADVYALGAAIGYLHVRVREMLLGGHRTRPTVERCALQADGTVLHLDCHTYVDGTVTNPALKLPDYIVTRGVR